MVEDIVLDTFPKESGVYIFKANEEVIYVGSSKNLYQRMKNHRSSVKQGSAHSHQQDLYQYLQTNTFAVEFQLTNDYRQLEQELVEKYNPKYNAIRAFTGLGTWNGREAEYNKERYQKYKEEILEQRKQSYESHKEQKKQYYESNKEQIKQYYESHKEEILEQRKQYYESHREEIQEQNKKYNNQLCSYKGETLTLNALTKRFKRMGIDHPTAEAKKYLIMSNND